MRFSRWVFACAGIWGLLVVPPLFFLLARVGRENPPAVTHPEFYYGFAAVATVWQLGFLTMEADPGRFRPLMPIAVLEKTGWIATLLVLYAQHLVASSMLPFATIDLLLGVLFAAAFVASAPQKEERITSRLPTGAEAALQLARPSERIESRAR